MISTKVSLLLIGFILICEVVSSQNQDVECVNDMEIRYMDRGVQKSLSFYDKSFKNKIVGPNSVRRQHEDEINNRTLDEVQIGPSSFYFDGQKLLRFLIKDPGVELVLSKKKKIHLGTHVDKLKELFPSAYADRRESYSREGIWFLRLLICTESAGKMIASDRSLIISWEEEGGMVDSIYISDPS